MRHVIIAAFLVACSTLSACAKTPEAPPATTAVQPYVLSNTEVRDLPATALNRDYQIFVSLPDSYKDNPTRIYPVLFVTDANYAFPLIRSLARRISDHGSQLNEFILVGLSYAQGDTPEYSRKRDYTPTKNGDHDPTDMPGRPFVFGQADAYQAYLKNDVLPFVAKTYRADMRHKIYAGHSYGGLLGMNILLSDPTMFDDYIIGSPSLYYDHFVMATREKAYASSHKDMIARVYMATGSYEAAKPAKRYNPRIDMVADIDNMARTLNARHYPHLHVETHVIDGEDHFTVFPDLITRGLFWTLAKTDRYRPY